MRNEGGRASRIRIPKKEVANGTKLTLEEAAKFKELNKKRLALEKDKGNSQVMRNYRIVPKGKTKEGKGK